VSLAANPWRGEASVTLGGRERILRPSFAALAAAEEELGSLLALVERAAAGQLRLAEVAALYWHCLTEREGFDREAMAEELLSLGLAKMTHPLRQLIEQIIQGAR
jgi:hypothetical protein